MANKVLEVKNNLDNKVRLLQAHLISKENRNVSIKEVHEYIGENCGLSGQTVAMIKGGNYTPSLLVALKLSEFFDVPVNELFYIEEVGEED